LVTDHLRDLRRQVKGKQEICVKGVMMSAFIDCVCVRECGDVCVRDGVGKECEGARRGCAASAGVENKKLASRAPSQVWECVIYAGGQ
jgi:hypothetical protein